MDLKKQAALTAATMVFDGAVVGLGAGSTIAYLVDNLKQRVQEGLRLKVVTSSYSTFRLLQEQGIAALAIGTLSSIDLYFDGCDQVDKNLHALKSGGGIHTIEKLLASMAGQFVLIGDKPKMVDTFATKYPLVLEILPESSSFVPAQVKQRFAVNQIDMRINTQMDGPVITSNGNYLLNVFFDTWPELTGINDKLKRIPGIVETSLFYGLAHKAVIAGNDGVETVSKN